LNDKLTLLFELCQARRICSPFQNKTGLNDLKLKTTSKNWQGERRTENH